MCVGERTRRRVRKSDGDRREEREGKQYKCRESVNAARCRRTEGEKLRKIGDAKMKSASFIFYYIPSSSLFFTCERIFSR